MQNNFDLYVYNHTDVINIYIHYHPQRSIKTRSTAVILPSFMSKIKTMNGTLQHTSFLPILYTNTHRFMPKLVSYSHNGSWMRWNTQTAVLHMDLPTPNEVRGQCLFYNYKQSQIMNSPKQILKSIFPRWNLWVNARVDRASVLQNRLLVKSELAKILALALAYHPLVDLTPFSVATAGGVVRKLERGSGGKESARKNIQSCLKLLKFKKLVIFQE